jgi:hypothetical protein
MGERPNEVTRRAQPGDGGQEIVVVRPGESDPPEEGELRAELEHTRLEMSQTIDAIQDRLNPEEITEDIKERATDVARDVVDALQEKLASPEFKAQASDFAGEVTDQITTRLRQVVQEATDHAKDAARQATVGRVEELVWSAGDTARETQATMMNTIKQNPVPAALVSVGLGWLFLNRSHRPAGPESRYPAYHGYTAYSSIEEGRTSYPESGRGGARGLANRAGEMADQAQDTAGRLAENAGGMVGDMASNAGDMASSAGETAWDAGSTLLGIIRQNPVPAALAGVSLGWLFLNGANSSPATAARLSHPTYAGGRTSSYPAPGHQGVSPSDEQSQGTAAGLVDTLGDTASQIQDQASDLASGAVDQVGQLGSQAQDQVQRARGRLEQIAQDNPLAAAVVTLAAGAVVGLALPVTDQENQMLGETRDRFMDKAQDVVQQTTQKVQTVADEVQSTAAKEAERQGLTGQSQSG